MKKRIQMIEHRARYWYHQHTEEALIGLALSGFVTSAILLIFKG